MLTYALDNCLVGALLFYLEISIIAASFIAVSFVVWNQQTASGILFNFSAVCVVLHLDDIMAKHLRLRETVLFVKGNKLNEHYVETESNGTRIFLAILMQVWLTLTWLKYHTNVLNS